ncbi:MAG: S-layer homology domain-containing protein, partial [Oscillospiraceae bacterium]|nr:S-layer homology domain-containing protein [Oscillospiraceae bacterium]
MKMKYKRLLSLILIIVIAIGVAIPALAMDTPQSSEWAVPFLRRANQAGLLTPSAARDPRADLTRAEFAELVVIIVEQTLGNPIPIPANNPFEDTNDINVLKAWQYGIVNGVSATRFAPDSPVQRQDLCTMVIRAIRQMETDLNTTLLAAPSPTLPFNDASMIQAHAIDPIRLAYSNGIMEGNALGNFNPRSPISSQECVAVAIRTFDMIEAVLNAGASAVTQLDMAYRRVHVGFDYGDTAMGVTRNVTLPTTLPSGATVSWHSSNPGVISSAGVVSLASGAQNVTLTATITVGTQTRTKAFPLRTSTLTGNQLLMENAFNALDIIYLNANDNADSVTGRVALPTTVLGLPVTWTSNNPTVISNMGVVTVPTDADARTVTLSAVINNAGQTRTKTFTLRVVNTAFAAQSVTLHNVGLGMTPAQVVQALGAPVRTISASATETWQLYHTNYNNFIAVSLIGGSVVGVYSMAPNAINHLRNAQGTVVTIAEANAIPGVTAVAQMDAGAIYSVMIFNTASPLASTRTLSADGQEQLLFELVNAFRVRNTASVLQWSQELSAAARQHSTEAAVSTPTQTLAQRAAAAGFPGNRYVGGNVLTGNYDAFDFFRQIVATPAMRTEILNA